MSKQPMSEWDKMVVADLKQDLENYKNGKLKTLSHKKSMQLVRQHIQKLQRKEQSHQAEYYRSIYQSPYARPAI